MSMVRRAWRPLSAVVLASGVAACGSSAPTLEDVERAVLERERATLQRYLAEADSGIVPFADMLVVLRGDLLQEVFDRVLPVEESVGTAVSLTLRRARVRFRSGLALVELDGRAAVPDRPDVFADLVVSGALDVTGIDAERGTLSARVEVLGFRTLEVGVGRLAPPAERLVDALATERAAEFEAVLGQLEVPIRLAQTLELPGVAEPEVTIGGGSVSLGLEVRDVRVLDDRVWVSIGGQVARAMADSADARGPT